MSTDARRSDARRARDKRAAGGFGVRVVAVIGALAVLAGVGVVVALMQGPRLTNVSVDPQAAIESSGSRVILTTNQALATVDPSQVTITPAADFTIDSQGRSVGVRFTSPLDDDTNYTVTVAGASAIGGGPAATLETTFTTPQASVYLLQRDGTGGFDMIVRMSLDGMERETLFTHEHIEEFRVAPDALVISVEEDEKSAIIVTDREGKNPQTATLPADGYVMSLQVSNRGSTFGYLFTDRVLTETEGRPSILYTASLRDPQAAPTEVKITGADPSIGDWLFVPDSEGILAVNFAGDLLLSEGEEPALLGNATSIDGVTRGTYEAIIDRAGEPVGVNLQTGEETPITLPQVDGTPGRVEPAAEGGQLWQSTQRDAQGMPIGNSIELVTADGETRTILATEKEEPIMQFCVSPSGKYVAAITAPDFANNPYDMYSRPMPKTVTRIVQVDDGSVISELAGFDISWCARSQF